MTDTSNTKGFLIPYSLPAWALDSWTIQYVLPKWDLHKIRASLDRAANQNKTIRIPGHVIIYCTEQERIVYPESSLMPPERIHLGETRRKTIEQFVAAREGDFDKMETLLKHSRPWFTLTAQQRLNSKACDDMQALLASLHASNNEHFSFKPLPALPTDAPLPDGTAVFKLWNGFFEGEIKITEHTTTSVCLGTDLSDNVRATYTLSDGHNVVLPLSIKDDGDPLPCITGNVKLFLSKAAAEKHAETLLSCVPS